MIWVTTRRLDWELQIRGPDLGSWPAEERAAALCLMRRCPVACRMVADRLAAEDDDVTADIALLPAMQRRLRRRLTVTAPAAPVMRWSVLAACALAGLYVGATRPDPEQADPFAPVQAVALDALP